MKRPYEEMMKIAQSVEAELSPHCERIQIAGSLRRKCDEIGDIEIVCIPGPYEIGMFASGIAKVCNQWKCIKGNFHAEKNGKKVRYTQREMEDGTKIDIFIATPENWGYILAIRTGSAEFSKTLAKQWKRKGFHGKDGMLHRTITGKLIVVPEEEYLFQLIGLNWVEPEDRK